MEVPDDFVHYEDLLPSGGIPMAGLRYVRFVDEEGESYMKFQLDGDEHLSLLVGDLYRIIHDTIMEAAEAE